MEVDSGSCYSLLNSDWWNRLGRPLLRQGPIFKAVSRNIIPVLGIANVEVRLNIQFKRLRVVCLDRPDTASLFGSSGSQNSISFQCIKLNLRQFHRLSRRFSQSSAISSTRLLYPQSKDLKPTSTSSRTPTSSCSNLDLCHMLFDLR